jgi:hypothetical protein
MRPSLEKTYHKKGLVGNNTRKLPVQLSLSQASKNTMFLVLSFTILSSTKSENKKVEQVLAGGRGGRTWLAPVKRGEVAEKGLGGG